VKRVVASLLVLALSTAAHADIVGPPGDPARHEKIVGISVADSGVALLAGGIIMLAIGATEDPATDETTKRALYLAGGLTTTVGALMTGVGFLVWVLARQKTTEWLKSGKPATPPGKVSFVPSGLRLTF
jgi:hypothetical protein